MKQFVADNGGMLAILAGAVVALGAYGEWRIASNVTTTVDGQKLAKAEDLEDLKDDFEEFIDDSKKADDRLEEKTDTIIRILLEDDS